MLNLQVKFVLGFFASLLLMAQGLSCLHEHAAEVKQLLATCIPSLTHSKEDEDASKIVVLIDLEPDSDWSVPAPSSRYLGLAFEDQYEAGSGLSRGSQCFARPPPREFLPQPRIINAKPTET